MTDANSRLHVLPSIAPTVGQFVSLRGRLWMVEAQPGHALEGHRLACIDDDASGEDAQVLWSAEVDAQLHDEEAWASLGQPGARGGGDAESFSAYLRTIRWRTATAAERDLFQAPFRAGTHADERALSGAACHSCLLVAETSCEARNLYLDRALTAPTVLTGAAALFGHDA